MRAKLRILHSNVYVRIILIVLLGLIWGLPPHVYTESESYTAWFPGYYCVMVEAAKAVPMNTNHQRSLLCGTFKYAALSKYVPNGVMKPIDSFWVIVPGYRYTFKRVVPVDIYIVTSLVPDTIFPFALVGYIGWMLVTEKLKKIKKKGVP